jgi:hypothetical protein
MGSNQPNGQQISLADFKTSSLQTLVDVLQARLIVAAVHNGAAVLAQVAALRSDLRRWIADPAEAVDLILSGGCFTFISSAMTRKA